MLLAHQQNITESAYVMASHVTMYYLLDPVALHLCNYTLIGLDVDILESSMLFTHCQVLSVHTYSLFSDIACVCIAMYVHCIIVLCHTPRAKTGPAMKCTFNSLIKQVVKSQGNHKCIQFDTPCTVRHVKNCITEFIFRT